MKTYRLGNWFLEPMIFKPGEVTEENFKLLAFDVWKVKGYEVLTSLEKAYYNNYVYIEFDLFRYRLWICTGKRFQVDYEFGLQEEKLVLNMYKGQLMLYYNPKLDEFFIVKRGVLFGRFLLETSFGTTLHKTYEELVSKTTILEDAIIVDEEF